MGFQSIKLNRIYFYVLFIIVILITIFSIILFQYNKIHNSINAKESILSQYYLPNLAIVSKLKQDLSLIGFKLEHQKPLESSLFSILYNYDQNNTFLNRLNKGSYREPLIESVFSRYKKKSSELQKLLIELTAVSHQASSLKSKDIESLLQSNHYLLEQFDRLNNRNAVTLSKQLSAIDKKQLENITHYSIAAFILCVFIIVIVIKLIRNLIKYNETLQSDLRTSHDSLESLVEKRTASLEASNRELEAYSYSIAHDLRTPLRGIIGFSQIVLEESRHSLSDDQIKMLTRVHSAGERMSSIIDEILKLSRLTRSELHQSKINLSDMVKCIIQNLESNLVTEHTVNWIIREDLSITGDKTLIHQCIENLISNAWKYSSKTLNSTIEIGSYIENNQTIYFVKDNGIGFSMEFANSIFDTFRRLHSTDDYEGTGIGLAIVKRVIDRHNGKVWATSELGKGATFYFYLGN